MLSVVCWKWKPQVEGYRSKFSGEHVNVLRSMVARHYKKPHRFICVTDDTDGIDLDQVEIVPLWSDYAELPSPHGGKNPSCYRRLKAFSAEAKQMFGERFVSIDLDCVIVGDVAPLWDRTENFVIWGDTNPTTPYNGSMFLLRSGFRRQVWEKFDPVTSPKLALKLGYFGSDQGWIAAALGKRERRWTAADGVYSYRNHLRDLRTDLPNNARIVFFHGNHDPWHDDVQQRHPWVKQHWR